MIHKSRLNLPDNTKIHSILISTLPFSKFLKPSLSQLENSFSFMVLEAQARPISITPSAMTCAHRARLFFVWHPLALLLSFLRVVVLLIHL
jgi:hypothetical protein